MSPAGSFNQGYSDYDDGPTWGTNFNDSWGGRGGGSGGRMGGGGGMGMKVSE